MFLLKWLVVKWLLLMFKLSLSFTVNTACTEWGQFTSLTVYCLFADSGRQPCIYHFIFSSSSEGLLCNHKSFKLFPLNENLDSVAAGKPLVKIWNDFIAHLFYFQAFFLWTWKMWLSKTHVITDTIWVKKTKQQQIMHTQHQQDSSKPTMLLVPRLFINLNILIKNWLI